MIEVKGLGSLAVGDMVELPAMLQGLAPTRKVRAKVTNISEKRVVTMELIYLGVFLCKVYAKVTDKGVAKWRVQE